MWAMGFCRDEIVWYFVTSNNAQEIFGRGFYFPPTMKINKRNPVVINFKWTSLD
jgi:hypothetical protein